MSEEEWSWEDLGWIRHWLWLLPRRVLDRL